MINKKIFLHKTWSLTTGTDNLVGTAGDDKFNGVLQDAGATGTTMQPGDVITGGAGTDTVNISVAGDVGTTSYTISAIQTDGVEKFVLSNFNTDEATDTLIATDLFAGLQTVGLSSSAASGDTQFDGLKNIVTAEMRNGAADLKLVYNSDVVTGTADSQALTVSNISGGTFTVDGIETLNVKTELVKSTLKAVSANVLKTINVTGAVDLTVTDATTATTIDGSAFTGKLNVTSGSADQKITGGTGDDTFNLVATLTTADTIDGGAGNDTLTLDAAALTTQFTKVSNIETVAFNAGTAAATLDVSKLSAGVTTVQMDLSDGADANGAIAGTISNLTGQAVILKHSVADAADVDNSDGVGYTITNKTDTADDTINVTLNAIGLNTGGAVAYGIDSLNVGNYETVVLASKKSTTVTANEVRSLTDSSAKTLNITGDADLTLTQTGTALTKVDASALVGKLNLTLGANKVAVTGSAKDDTFVFAANLNNSDTIIGGDGNDTLTATVTGLSSTTGVFNIAGVETVTLTTSGDNTLDLSKVTGATSVAVSANTQTITGLDLATKLILTSNATVNVTAANATGASDTLTVEQKLDSNVTNVIKAADIENLNIILNDTNAGGGGGANAAVFTLTDFTGTKVTVSESATTTTTGVTVDLGTLNKTVTTIDTSGVIGAQTANASAATFAVTFNAAGGAVATLTGSAQGDTINVSSTGAVTHVIDGGAGTDILNIAVKAGFANAGSITNVETINATVNAGDAVAVTTAAFTSTVKTLNVLGGNSISTFNAGTVNAALTTLNAASFLGALSGTIASDNFDDTLTVVGSALSTDSITSTYATAATYKPKVSAVETLKITASDAATNAVAVVLDLSNSTGVTTIEATVGDADKLTVANATNQLIKVKAASATTAAPTVEVTLADATGSSDSVSFELSRVTDANSIADSTILKTTDVETINLKASTGAETVSLASLAMTDSTKYEKLVVTGDQALTVSALNANVNVIDASGLSTGGSFVQAGRSGTTAATYTGSAGNDTFLMKNYADVIDGGKGTDTLSISGTLILGGVQVDLSATDQITSYNGSANATVQTGFENIDLSGLVGSYGADITAIKTGSNIVGTSNTDQINGGAGVDTIKGGAGADSIALGGNTNTVIIASGSESSLTAMDTISDLVLAGVASTTFTLKDNGTETGVTTGVLTATATNLGGAANLTAALDLLAAGAGNTNGIVTWGVYGGNTYVVEDLSAGATFVDGTDIAVKITGSVDLLNSTNLIVTFA